MNKLTSLLIGSLAAVFLLSAAPQLEAAAPKIGTVNFKECVETSKYGKQEQNNFENMKKQMEDVLQEKEKTLTDLSNKFNDPDYLDSLSDDAEAEMKHKFRSLNQELSQHQQQYYQILQQANFKIIQGISEKIQQASQAVAKQKGLDLIMNDEGAFFHNPSLDVSKEIVKAMDDLYAKENKK